MYKKNFSGKRYLAQSTDRSNTMSKNSAGRKKQIIAITAILALLCAVISCVTLAYVFTKTTPVQNTFDGAKVDNDIEEKKFDGTTKENVSIKNTGTVKSYIRAAVIVTWVKLDESGNVTQTYAATPVENTDYTIEYENVLSDTDTDTDISNKWIKGDGYWYYSSPVAANSNTEVLIKACTEIDNGGTKPEGYSLSVEIIASAIQAEPTDAVIEAWNVAVDDEGNITPHASQTTEG